MTSNRIIGNSSSLLSGVNEDGEDESMMLGISKSPGSLLGSSIRSTQVQSFDIESESCSVAGETPSWRLGTPWLSSTQNKEMHSNNKSSNDETHEVDRYYGGIMKSAGDASSGSEQASPNSTTSNHSRLFASFRKGNKRATPPKNKKRSSKTSNKYNSGNTKTQPSVSKTSTDRKTIDNNDDDTSIPIARTKSIGADSIADFDDSEWTPPDSSYGAACPVCGFIPKRVRQMIEMTLIAAMVFYLIYLLVMISNKIAEKSESNTVSASIQSYNTTNNSSASSSNIYTDDALYMENDDAMENYYGGEDDGYNSGQYAANDDAGAGNQNYYNSNTNYNSYSNNNYNSYNGNYNQNRYRRYSTYNDDYNGGQRRRNLRRSYRSRDMPGHDRNEVQWLGWIFDRIKR